MKFLKNNLKLVIGLIIGAILASGITVYATTTYLANQVIYTREGTDIKNVEEALNDLYGKKITTKGTEWNSGTLITEEGDNDVDIGFIPSKIVFTISSDATTCVYNSEKSTSQTYTCHSTAIATFPLGSDSTSSSHIKSIGSTTVFKAGSSGATWYWFAVK